MKTLILTTVLVILVTFSFSQETKNTVKTLDSKELKCVIYPCQNDIVTMILEKEPGEIVKLKVRDEDKKLLFQSRIKKENCKRVKFDLKEFPSGNYTFELIRDKEVVYHTTINKSDKTIAVAK